MGGTMGHKNGKNCPRWGRFSLSMPEVRQAPSLSLYITTDVSFEVGCKENEYKHSNRLAPLTVFSKSSPHRSDFSPTCLKV